MKDRNCGLRNKQKDHQSRRDSKWGNWRESKIKQRDAERGRDTQKAAEEIYMPGEECCISDLVPLCHLNHCRFLMPWALLYKAQTAAGFSTLRLWNWINTMPVHVFAIISQHPEGPALTGCWPPVSFCSLLAVSMGNIWHTVCRPKHLQQTSAKKFTGLYAVFLHSMCRHYT